MELIDSTGLTYIWCYVVPGDDGTREEGKTIASARVYIVLKAAIPLVLLSAGMSRCSAWISTKLCTILYIRTDLAFSRLCSSDSHFKLEIIDVTAPGSRS